MQRSVFRAMSTVSHGFRTATMRSCLRERKSARPTPSRAIEMTATGMAALRRASLYCEG